MIKMGVIMDPMDQIHVQKDTTIALMLEAKKRGWKNYYIEQNDLLIENGEPYGLVSNVELMDNRENWYQLDKRFKLKLADLDIILMRKDPPVDNHYLYTTQILSIAEQRGVLILNSPQALRDINEKIVITLFPESSPPTLVTADPLLLREFITVNKETIIKPLHGMGGASIFKLCIDDPNIGVVIETLTQYGKHLVMIQRYIKEVQEGDKRILLIDGEPFPYALARYAAPGETRSNLAVGGKGKVISINERDRWLCEQIKSFIKNNKLIFVGLDVIGDYITEINVTSPTCIRELESETQVNISGLVLDSLEKHLYLKCS